MTFEIEKGVPLIAAHRTRPEKYPWTKMNVGDSFFVPGVSIQTMVGSATPAGRRHGRKYTTRKVEGGVRVWRIA